MSIMGLGGGDLVDGLGDAYCGVLNCSYNLGMRHLNAFISEYSVGTAADIAKMIEEYAPIKGLYELGEGCYYPDLGERMAQFELTLLDINNSVPAQMWEEQIKGKFDYTLNRHLCGLPPRRVACLCYQNITITHDNDSSLNSLSMCAIIVCVTAQ